LEAQHGVVLEEEDISVAIEKDHYKNTPVILLALKVKYNG
jgi:hypothetical protein